MTNEDCTVKRWPGSRKQFLISVFHIENEGERKWNIWK